MAQPLLPHAKTPVLDLLVVALELTGIRVVQPVHNVFFVSRT
jgi:hypothetical protein